VSGTLLLDTHIALWLDSGSERLRRETRATIDGCWKAGGTVLLSSVTAWEIAFLVDTGRVTLDVSVDAWVARFTARPGVAALPLSHRAAARAYQLYAFEHRDPADRLLIATAVELGASLVTYDERIARFGERYGGQYGLKVLS
jgi:PIN domain nuclease of toxin-antitoxin system